MLTDDYRLFKKHIPVDKIRVIQEIIGYDLRSVAWDMYGVSGDSRAATLEQAIIQALKLAGEVASYNSESYFDDLVTKWKKQRGSRDIAVAVYYFLHTSQTGKALAEKIDVAVFEGKTFYQHLGFRVPGEYHRGKEQARHRQGQSSGGVASHFLHPYNLTLARELTEGFSGRADTLSDLNSIAKTAATPDRNWITALYGGAGVGKSSIGAEWCRRWVEQPRHYVAFHACDTLKEPTTDLRSALEYLGLAVQDAMASEGMPALLDNTLPSLLATDLPPGMRLSVWIDGLDQARGLYLGFYRRKLVLAFRCFCRSEVNSTNGPSFFANS